MLAAIILAAGESKRFGSPKQLYKIDNKTLIETAIATCVSAKIDQIIVVLGAHRELIEPILPKNITIAINEHYLNGQTSSIQCGINKLTADVDAFFVVPVDLGLIKTQTIAALTAQFKQAKPLIAIPTYNSHKGHPPLYAISVAKNILALKNDEPLYTINIKFAKETLLVSVDDANILKNINTPHDT
jgi:molybdenum cofactor cytidylyltransferase